MRKKGKQKEWHNVGQVETNNTTTYQSILPPRMSRASADQIAMTKCLGTGTWWSGQMMSVGQDMMDGQVSSCGAQGPYEESHPTHWRRTMQRKQTERVSIGIADLQHSLTSSTSTCCKEEATCVRRVAFPSNRRTASETMDEKSKASMERISSR